jgi:hypothetical protein
MLFLFLDCLIKGEAIFDVFGDFGKVFEVATVLTWCFPSSCRFGGFRYIGGPCLPWLDADCASNVGGPL